MEENNKQLTGVSKILEVAISDALKTYGIDKLDFDILVPTSSEHGDYSTNAAMQLFPNLEASTFQNEKLTSPWELAGKLKDKLAEDVDLKKYISKIEVAGSGFINFWLKEEYLADELGEVIERQDSHGKLDLMKGKKVVVEYTDPNPFKEFHIGHLYSNSVGESIARLKEATGARVWRADYFGDVGMHVAKSIWGLLKKFKEEDVAMEILEKKPLNERIKYLGQAYAKGATSYEEDEEAKEEMKELNYVIFASAQSFLKEDRGWEAVVDYKKYIKGNKYKLEEIELIYKKGRAWSLEYFETIYKRLGTKFDGYYPESVAGEYGYGFVIEGLEKGVFVRGEGGAVIFPGEKYGLHNRVFINSLGFPTYEAKELGLAPAKYEDIKYDESIIITGNEINEYFKVLLCALNKVNPKLGMMTNHVGHGMVRLPEGKMSSRTGKIIRGEWLIDEAKKKILEILEKSGSVAEEERDAVAEEVGIGAVKYALLKQGIGANIAFDFGKSLAFEGNSGPYIQYTHARTQSVLKKADQGVVGNLANTISAKSDSDTDKYEFNEEELALLRTFPKFPEIVADAAEKYAPNMVCNYLYDLASKYNAFYNKHSILEPTLEGQALEGDELEVTKKFRLALTSATGIILKNGLKLLGIKAPEKM